MQTSFYDFDMYRQILAGDMRAVYTGAFADRASEVELKETVIKVRVDAVGGEGPMLCAGFDDTYDDEEEEQRRIEAGYGWDLCTNENEVDQPGWTKEILVSGKVSLMVDAALLVSKRLILHRFRPS